MFDSTPVPAEKIRLLAFAAMTIAGVGTVLAGTPFEPVRRDARIELRVSSPTPAFVSADFVIPRATTRELAEYAKTAGARAAVQWLCDAYAVPPATDPDAASLRQLVDVAAATIAGSPAADALVCPRINRHVHVTKRKITNIFACIFGDCDDGVVTYRAMSHILAYPGCVSTAPDRAAFDTAQCSRALLGRSRRATTFRFFTRRAAMKNGCLQITLAGQRPSVRLYDRTFGCE